MKKDKVFDELRPLLVEAIPSALASIKIEEPINCVKIYYFDTHAPCTYLELKSVTERHRQRVLEKAKERAHEYLWSAGESCGDGRKVLLGGKSGETRNPIVCAFDRIHALLDRSEKYMIPFREMLRQVARELNAKEWRGRFPVTDDFIFIPADGSAHFGGELNADYHDIKSSISVEQLERLRAKGLIRTGSVARLIHMLATLVGIRK